MADFSQTLSDIYNGGLLDDLSERLTQVVKASEQTGKTGSITLTLKIKTQGSSGQVEIKPVIKSVVPEFENGTALMFITPEGNLQLNDPRQKKLDLKVVNREPIKFQKAN